MNRRLFLSFLSMSIAIPIIPRTCEARKRQITTSVLITAIKLAYRSARVLYAIYTGFKNWEEVIEDFRNIYAKTDIDKLTDLLTDLKSINKKDVTHELINVYNRKKWVPEGGDEKTILTWLGRVWDLISIFSREDIKQLLQLLLRGDIIRIQAIKDSNGDLVVDGEGQPIMTGTGHPIFQKAWRILFAGEN